MSEVRIGDWVCVKCSKREGRIVALHNYATVACLDDPNSEAIPVSELQVIRQARVVLGVDDPVPGATKK